jgi:hypothetical protein
MASDASKSVSSKPRRRQSKASDDSDAPDLLPEDNQVVFPGGALDVFPLDDEGVRTVALTRRAH